MATPQENSTVTELEARLAELEHANAQLAAELASRTPRARARGPRWRGAVAVLLIVIAALLTPAAITAGWARVLLGNTDSFVATYGPLIHNPKVQAYISEEVVLAIEQQVDIDASVNEVIDGLQQSMPDRPRVNTALDLLRQPAIDGVRSTLYNVTYQVVSSDAFAQVWQESLRLTHDQVTNALSGDPNSSLVITRDGLGLKLGPLIDRVKQSLVDQGFTLASQIPAIDKTIVIAKADSLVQVQLAYRAALVSGYWLGIVVLGLLVAAVLVSVRRWHTTIGAAVGLGLGGAAVLAGVGVGKVVAQASVPIEIMPNDVLVIFIDTITGAINDLATATVLLAIVVGIVAWLGGPFRSAGRVRSAYAGLTQNLRERADSHGLSTGRAGEWLYNQRVLLRVLVALVAAAVLVMSRPISAPVVVTTAVVALLALLVLSLLQRPPGEPTEPAVAESLPESETEVES
ncbi:MAG TPA: hypothetical protein PKD84_09595 [Propionicimonas sp.]|nr:hypothetical protein [Propionicimonas sp.]